MARIRKSQPQALTLDILREELSGVEKRLEARIDSKIDEVGHSFKEYVDSRLTGVETRLSKQISALQADFGTMKIPVFDHERRLKALEPR